MSDVRTLMSVDGMVFYFLRVLLRKNCTGPPVIINIMSDVRNYKWRSSECYHFWSLRTGPVIIMNIMSDVRCPYFPLVVFLSVIASEKFEHACRHYGYNVRCPHFACVVSLSVITLEKFEHACRHYGYNDRCPHFSCVRFSECLNFREVSHRVSGVL